MCEQRNETDETLPPTGSAAAADGDNMPVPIISKALYKKAEQHNDQLTKVERILLFSRRDVIGKALTYPASLNERQRNLVMLRPPPEVLEANIKRVGHPQSVLEGGNHFFLTWFPL